jgi:hypothetical protein
MKIAEAWRSTRTFEVPMPDSTPPATYLLENLLDERLRLFAAMMWEEGFDAGHYTENENHECDCKVNPYRQKADDTPTH